MISQTASSCRYSEPAIKDVRWSSDGRRIAALVNDTTTINSSEQIQIFNLNYPDCGGTKLVETDKFPADYEFDGAEIPSYDWDGRSLFLLNDAIRTNRFGNLYLYDSSAEVWTKINSIDGTCCYRDARWSPDGKYLLFLYQSRSGGSIELYFIPYAEVGKSEAWRPVRLLPDFFKPSARPEPAFQPSR